jgi:UDP-N-acetylglucosamine 2-epimerase (non-hydrolysing)
VSVKLLHVVGARPNFIKIAPLLAECGRRPGFVNTLVHTGQHYDERMSRLFFEELGIPRPDLDLEVGSGSHAQQTAAILSRFEAVVLERRPDLLVVVGDVNSTLACSLAAAKLLVPVAHVEAGLRSFDRTMPEEINRIVTDALSDLLFVSEESGMTNLAREGVPAQATHFVGNVMIDTLLAHQERARAAPILESLGLPAGAYAVLTLHRPANVDDPAALERILVAIAELSRRMPVVFPVHPRSRAALQGQPAFRAQASQIVTTEPLGYLDFLKLLMEARLVLTDSGGVQEETTILDVPCVTLRENTERPVTVTHGTNRLAGTTTEGIRRAIEETLAADRSGLRAPPPLWDGRAASRIADVIEGWAAARGGASTG